MKSHHIGRWILAIALLGPGLVAVLADDSGQVVGGEKGDLHVVTAGTEICSLKPVVADANWRFYSAKAGGPPAAASTPDVPFPFAIAVGDKNLTGELKAAGNAGVVDATWNFSSNDEFPFQVLVVATDFPLPSLAGGTWETDSAHGTFPPNFQGDQLFDGSVHSLAVTFPNSKRVLKFTFPNPTDLTLQDNRQWGTPTFTFRFGRGPGKLAANETYTLEMGLTSSEGLSYSRELPDFMKPVVLKADDEWIPLHNEGLDIVAGSALDMSSFGFTDGPCGSKGRLIVSPDGHFVCANEPDKPKRFYGVNLCFTASYLPKDRVDELLDRLVRLGYNAIRIHHYEAHLTTPEWTPSFDWDPAIVDQLDYLMAGCAKRGIWITTDLFVSRPISGKQIGLPDDKITMNKFKVLIPVYEPAYQDWTKFARKFLDRTNPYTGKRVADDPALAWISLVNEGPATNHWGEVMEIPEWTAAWNRWLAARFPTRDELAAALGDLTDKEDPKSNTVALPSGITGDSARVRLCQVFVAETEKATYERMRDFLRNDVKCPALLTDMNNAGPQVVPLQAARSEFDYVDDHFYVDHPQFLEEEWRLPSFCSNSNPIETGATGGSSSASVRLWGKPFTLSEFNYAGPSCFRGVGGLLTGAMAALQDWDAVWRFDYSGTADNLFQPAPLGYFDVVADPLNQAADRLALFLYLRGDLERAPSRLAVVIPRSVLNTPPNKNLTVNGLQSVAWTTRVGSLIVDDAQQPTANFITVPYQSGNDNKAIGDALGKIKASPSSPDDNSIHSETGQMTILPSQGILVVDTPKSAGGFADAGKLIDAPGAGVKIDNITTGATVFVNSLDSAPIKSSKRLLVTHLTDLQNTGSRFNEAAHQTLLGWGVLPHLVRAGSADVHINLDEPEAYTVWALSTDGRRQEKVDSKVESGQLVFTASVRGADGARMLYEVAR